MGYNGYLSLGGTELVNEQRTRRYVENQFPSLPLRRNFPVSDTLNVALGHQPYESPLVDDAEWANPADPATHGFFGLYPLDIQGLGDGTTEADVTESLTAGGTVSQPRDATREIRVHGLLLGDSVLAVEAGLSWLRAALRSQGCGSHGLLCGTNDLRFFLADPDVCYPKFDMVEGRPPGGVTTPLGAVSPDTSPLIVNIDQMLEAPAYVEWQFQLVDGVVITWGRLSRRDSSVISQSEPTIVQRTNYASNPSFDVGTVGWVAASAGIARIAAGGVDGGPYGRLQETNPPVVTYNWMPDPGFVNPNPVTSGWRIAGGSASTGDAGLPGQEARLATFTKDPGATELLAEISMIGPSVTPSEATVTFGRFPHTEPIVVEIVNNVGELVHTEEIAPTAEPAGTSINVTLAKDYILRFRTVGDQMQLIAMSVVEGHDYAGAWFSGDTESVPGFQYSWLGAPLLSASRESLGTPTPHTLTLNAPDTRYGDLMATFWIKSDTGAQLTAQLISRDDGTVMATRSITTNFGWTRYSLATAHGRNVRLVIFGTGSYDIDQVLIEASAQVWDYFDGNTPAPMDYTTRWLGAAGVSYSRTSWVGSTVITAPDSDWRPFLSSLQGTLPDVTVDIGHYDEITVEAQLEPYERSLHDVKPIQAPRVISRPELRFGAAIEVDFLLVAETPYIYSNSREIDVTGLTTAAFVDPEPLPDPDNELIDPDCPPLPAPPRPPAIPELCVEEIDTWQRYYLDIPAEHVALWASTVPTLSVVSRDEAVRQLRVRFHPNPFGYAKEDVDPLSYCGEFIVSYLPAQTTLTVNGMNSRAWASVAGGEPLPADTLLYGTGGTPMQWPELSCGIPYVMTIDIPPTDDLENLDFELFVNRRE